MRIFYSSESDPMLMDTVEGPRGFSEIFEQFIMSPDAAASFEAETSGTSAPYKEFLCGLRVQKSEGSSGLFLSEDKWLELSGGARELEEFRSKLSGVEDGEHDHWYSSPISLIIEADESWPGWEGS
jgi:hypothetical protein